MPRGPRLDTPGALHHVMVRGIERTTLFRDDVDRTDFVTRLGRLAAHGALTVYAWALLPNHAHLLVRTGARPLATGMRALLAGYAGAFNRRHRRVGHLFQNRYKSILVEEDPYLLELIRYIHLNPLRSGVVPDLPALDRYPWSGHRALVGRAACPWQATGEVLGQYGGRGRAARQRYRAFVAAGVAQGRRPDLQGGGLIRSLGGWTRAVAVRRGREAWAADERILGSSDFVEAMWRAAAAQSRVPPRAVALRALPGLLARCAAAFGVRPAELVAGSRRRPVAQARAVATSLAVRELGLPIAVTARAVGLSATAARRGVLHGQALLAQRGLTRGQLISARRK